MTPAQALDHPTWKMGPKITVDSSTLMNKGLEVIEAHELFGVPYDRIDVVVHPQSVVHSMVEFTDASTIAQLSMPDMRLPIGYALAYPFRIGTPFGRIDWGSLSRLDFAPPDTAAFGCLSLAYDAGRTGGTAPAWLSAANEVAVDAFLDELFRLEPVLATDAGLHDHDARWPDPSVEGEALLLGRPAVGDVGRDPARRQIRAGAGGAIHLRHHARHRLTADVGRDGSLSRAEAVVVARRRHIPLSDWPLRPDAPSHGQTGPRQCRGDKSCRRLLRC